MNIRRLILGGLLLAGAAVLMNAAPAGASCAGPSTRSPHAFTGTVTKVDNGGRVATVRTDDGRVVTVVGTPDESAAATSVDRQYVLGERYRFHPHNGESPYRDDACTATTRIDAGPSTVGVSPGGSRAGPDKAEGAWLPIVVGAVAVAAALMILVLVRRRQRPPPGAAASTNSA